MSDDDSKYPSELAERFQVRLPLGMRDRIKAAAEANNRSMNAEIVATLEEKYPEPAVNAEDIAREYREIAMLALDPETPQSVSKTLIDRMNDLDRAYRDLTGRKL
jgi:hypothetical protein